MRVVIQVLVVTVLSAGSDVGVAPSDPFWRGTITSRDPMLVGVQDGSGVRVDSIPRLLLEDPLRWYVEPCARRMWFVFDDSTRVLDRQAHQRTRAT